MDERERKKVEFGAKKGHACTEKNEIQNCIACKQMHTQGDDQASPGRLIIFINDFSLMLMGIQIVGISLFLPAQTGNMMII